MSCLIIGSRFFLNVILLGLMMSLSSFKALLFAAFLMRTLSYYWLTRLEFKYNSPFLVYAFPSFKFTFIYLEGTYSLSMFLLDLGVLEIKGLKVKVFEILPSL